MTRNTLRTVAQERARYNYLPVSEVATVLACDDELVRAHIKEHAFPDVGGEPGVVNIGSGKLPQYRIHPESLAAFLRAKAA